MLLIAVGFIMVIAGAFTLFSQNDTERDQITNTAWTTDTQADSSGTTATNSTTSDSVKTTTTFDTANYTIKTGDSWWKIAELHLNDAYQYKSLAHFNDHETAQVLEVGEVIAIPTTQSFMAWKNLGEPANPVTSQREKITQQVAGVSTDGEKIEYTVQPNDSLWSIAREQLGDGYHWIKIKHLNSMNNPGIISPGQKLLLPKKSELAQPVINSSPTAPILVKQPTNPTAPTAPQVPITPVLPN